MNAEHVCLSHTLIHLIAANSNLKSLEGVKTIKENLTYLIDDVQTKIKELEKDDG